MQANANCDTGHLAGAGADARWIAKPRICPLGSPRKAFIPFQVLLQHPAPKKPATALLMASFAYPSRGLLYSSPVRSHRTAYKRLIPHTMIQYYPLTGKGTVRGF